MVVEILARAFNAVMEALALNFAELTRRSIPTARPCVNCRWRTFLQGCRRGHGW
jgi:hypothetical protein